MYGQKRVGGGVGQSREPKLGVCCLRTSAHPFLAKSRPGAPVFGHCPLVFCKTRHSPDRRPSCSLHPPQMTAVLTAQFFGGSSGIGLYLEDELTPGSSRPFSRRLEMESLPLIMFDPHALAATRGVLRKSDRSG